MSRLSFDLSLIAISIRDISSHPQSLGDDADDLLNHQPNFFSHRKFSRALGGLRKQASQSLVRAESLDAAGYVVLEHADGNASDLRREVARLAFAQPEVLLHVPVRRPAFRRTPPAVTRSQLLLFEALRLLLVAVGLAVK